MQTLTQERFHERGRLAQDAAHPLTAVKVLIERLQADVRQLSPAELEDRLRILQGQLADLEQVIRPAAALTHGLKLDHSRRQVQRGERVVQLTMLEYRLLSTLCAETGSGVSAERLIEAIWGRGGGDKVMLKQLVHRLRRKLEQGNDSAVIETVPGVGYALAV